MREGVYANWRLCDFRGESSLLANYCTNANKSVLIYDRLIHFATIVFEGRAVYLSGGDVSVSEQMYIFQVDRPGIHLKLKRGSSAAFKNTITGY